MRWTGRVEPERGKGQAALFIRLPSAVASLFHVGWPGRGRLGALPVDAWGLFRWQILEAKFA
jgi:hypothetical protein